MIKNLVLAAFLLVGLFAVYRLGGVNTQSKVLGDSTSATSSAGINPFANDPNRQVTWCIDPIKAVKKCFDPISYTEGDSALATFMSLAARENISYQTKDYGDLGIMVTGIRGVITRSNAEKTLYWQFWINDKEATVGASSTKAENHARYQFIYGD